MNRFKTPSCSRCKIHYQLGDAYGAKLPMLLQCGHDMCRNCTKLMFKKNKLIICEVCEVKFEFENQICDIPIHYYLVGKIWYSFSNKKLEINRNISNLKMTNSPTESSKKKKKICKSCHKFANYFCQQCNDVYCEKCSKMIHMDGEIMSLHDIEMFYNEHLKLPLESTCHQHLKVIDVVCITCHKQLCSFCAIENHRQHNILPLEKYNMNSVQHFNEYISKGEILLKQFKNYRDKYNVKMQKRKVSSSIKLKNNYDENRLNVTTFISNLAGNLQCLELKILNSLDKSEQILDYSVQYIINQLDCFIDDLQIKLNTVDLLLSNNMHSSPMLMETISNVEHMLNTSYYIAKKNRSKPEIFFNSQVFSVIYQCITAEIDYSNKYILNFLPELPFGYVLCSKIELNNDVLSDRSISSASSISTLSSNLSTTVSTDEVIKYSSNTGVQIFTNSLSIKEITKNSVESVVVTHINSPSDFYLQLDANYEIMKNIEEEIYKFIQINDNVVENIEMNIMYAAQISINDWCRGIVINICEEDNTKMYTFLCIDYGSTDILTADRFRNVPPNIVSIPQLAFNCALYDLKPSAITGWSNDAYTLFNKLISNKSGLIMYVKEINCEPIEVDIICKDNIYPLCIRDALFYLGYGAPNSYFNQSTLQQNQLLDVLTLPKSIKLNEKEEYSVVLSHFITPHNFYIRLDENTAVLENIMKKLESMYKPTEADVHKNYLLYTPQIGMAVAALYSLDSNWYRAKIINLPEPRMVTVFYIDFGNSETLPWDQLRVLDISLIKTPPLSIKALLSDIHPAIDCVECDKWSENAHTIFLDLLEANKHIEDNLTALVTKVDADTCHIVLYKHTSRGEICLNNKLVTCGYATISDPEKCIFNKQNTRKLPIKPIQMNNRNIDAPLPNNDTMLFIKQRTVIESKNHTWDQTNKKKVPGIKMTVHKIISPDEITLKYFNHNFAELKTIMNKVYSTNSTIFKNNLDWKVNDLCALFIKKFGNWYRGKILKLNTIKRTATINLYDLDEIHDDISIETLYILENKCTQVRCGILHCKMDKLVPLGTSDGKWSKFSCDRLIEKLRKYPYVYFSRKNKENNISLGEIWVRDINEPQALEPLSEHWININRFMINQGFALCDNLYNSKDDVYSGPSSESEVNNFLKLKSLEYTNCWMPPDPITNSQFNAVVSYVDMKCGLYLQNKDGENANLLHYITSELNSIFCNSKPEPINVKWSVGQMVIVKYHIDNMWYRGSITEKMNNGKYAVQFLDYGNIEICCHDNLRSTLYMTDIPQLQVKAYFSTILPMTKNNKWPINTLDYIHAMIVDKQCTVVVDLEMSNSNNYAITCLKLDKQSNFCQHLVSCGYAYFTYIDTLKLDLLEPDCNDKNNDNQPECLEIERETALESIQYANSTDDSLIDEIDNDYKTIDDNNRKIVGIQNVEQKLENYNKEIQIMQKIQNNIKENSQEKANKVDDKSKFMKFCLNVNSNEVIEGILCNVTGPTRMILLIVKIGGVDITLSKDEMQVAMLNECTMLPALDKIIPGTAVAVSYNFLWRRGIISNDCNTVYLVDLGISIKLIKNNLKLLPKKFLILPMFSINCQIVNVKKNENANDKDVIKELSRLLKAINLKIIVTNELNEVYGVELYNEKGEIAYQSLIDSKLLVSK